MVEGLPFWNWLHVLVGLLLLVGSPAALGVFKILPQLILTGLFAAAEASLLLLLGTSLRRQDRLVWLKVFTDSLVDRLLAELVQVLGSFDLDHVLHGHLVSDALVLLVCVVDVDACISLLPLQRRLVVRVLVRPVCAHDDVHAVVLQRVPVPQVALADPVLALLGRDAAGVGLLLLDARFCQYVHVLVSRWQL